jgi:Inositol hexakisphosphate
MKRPSIVYGFLFFLFYAQEGKAQVNFAPSWLLGFHHLRTTDDFVLSPYDILFDSRRGSTLPKLYRTPVDFFPSPALSQALELTGFSNLFMSGSAQYSQPELKELITHIHHHHQIPLEKIYIVDLREEPHGFINEAAVSWFYGPLPFQQNKSAPDVLATERVRIHQVRAFPIAVINTIEKSPLSMPGSKNPMLCSVESVMQEQEAVQSLGATYIRLPVTDHFRPEDIDIDAFVTLVQNLSTGAWLHFKCRGGKGRTTTFMTLFDITQNPTVPLHRILERQKALGGTNLAKVGKPKRDAWKQRLSADRMTIIRIFYEYRRAADGWGQRPFSEWVKKQAKSLGYLGDRFSID